MNYLPMLAFVVSVACAGLMGFAIQRGATCTVAAVEEWMTRRRCTRIVSMLEASLWVVAGLLIARTFDLARAMPAAYAVGPSTVVGGGLLGLGAYVNRACVFGAIARLGSGEWAYAVTPLGFFAGCIVVAALSRGSPVEPLADPSALLNGPAWLAAVAAGLVLLRAARPVFSQRAADDRTLRRHLVTLLTCRVWSPHAATCVIGITFVVILLLSGAWAYTDVLAELARGMAASLPARIALLLALFGGAVIGGATAGRFRNTRITASQLARCFTGGFLMGGGSLLIPGSNDGLILIGMPLLRPYAWIAFITMCVVIGASMRVARSRSAAAANAVGATQISRAGE